MVAGEKNIEINVPENMTIRFKCIQWRTNCLTLGLVCFEGIGAEKHCFDGLQGFSGSGLFGLQRKIGERRSLSECHRQRKFGFTVKPSEIS